MESTQQSNFPRHENKLDALFQTFSRWQWIVFWISSIVFAVTALILLLRFNDKLLVTIPARGGTYKEGVIGTPRFINPLLALSDADKDMTALVYSGLMRKDANGDLIPDLAQSYTISDDGLSYTFKLRTNIYFQDNTKVTSADVVYTVNEAKDSTIKSQKSVLWSGVTASAPDAQTVVFTLKQRYASFLDDTTLGILPEHLWQNVTADQFGLNRLNTNPVGSGPFKIGSTKSDKSGVPTEYDLNSFSKFALGEPYLSHLVFKFYGNENDLVSALKSGSVDAINSISSENALTLALAGYKVQHTVLPRVFGLYFNTTQNPVFADSSVGRAIDLVIDKNAIITSVLSGYGTVIDTPILPEIIEQEPATDVPDLGQAADILAKAGWKKDANGIWQKTTGTGKKAHSAPLSFSIATADTPELKNAAQAIATQLNSFGMQVDVKVFEVGTLNQTVIRTRKFDVLFFGQVVNHDTDLFAFWDSSQQKDPGLNIAGYASAKADKDLETANGTLDAAKRDALIVDFIAQINKDRPAVFVYSPDFIYVTRKEVAGMQIASTISTSDRFANVWEWYQNEDHVWPIVAKLISPSKQAAK